MSVMAPADINKAPAMDSPALPSDKPSLVDLKNGKLHLKQKVLSFAKMSETMQEIVRFREMLEQRLAEGQPPVTVIPDEHRPLIAKMVHESEKTLQALSKNLQQELAPSVDEDDEDAVDAARILPTEVVEQAIKSVATRVNYGLDPPAGGGKVPPGWHIWRWEVLDNYRDWLPKASREKVDARLFERHRAKNDVRALFESLSDAERASIIGNKGNNRAPVKLAKSADGSVTTATLDVVASSSTQAPKREGSVEIVEASGSNNEVGTVDGTKKGSARPKKAPLDPEKAAKEQERLEKRALKAQREKKEKEEQTKSASLMASFFGKPKAPTASPSKPGPSTKTAAPTGAQTPHVPDFSRTFKPFALKKDAELAPMNWFREQARQRRRRRRSSPIDHAGRDVIVIDDDDTDVPGDDSDIEMVDAQVDDVPLDASAQERLRSIIRALNGGRDPPLRRPFSGYRTRPRHSVREVMAALTEAEVAGDDARVRALLALLRDRTRIPAKVLIFHEDARPGRFGTWTRASRVVGPRTPFARDALAALDYTCDSGEEWEEEDEGEDVHEDAGEEPDEDDGDPDSDADSWLVDDDELEEGTGSPPPDLDFDAPWSAPPTTPKRKQEKEKEKEDGGKATKKRRVVVPLVPFSKGPEWEPRIGACTYEPFQAYRIQLLNDTPYPIDPFHFVSVPAGQQSSVPAAPAHAHVPPPPADDAGFAVPALPQRLVAHNGAGAGSPNTKARALAPKTSFPDAHLPLLLARIVSLGTSSLHCIVETVHLELQAHRVKKNAIEAKVREVGEKNKERKVWVVKPEFEAQIQQTS